MSGDIASIRNGQCKQHHTSIKEKVCVYHRNAMHSGSAGIYSCYCKQNKTPLKNSGTAGAYHREATNGGSAGIQWSVLATHLPCPQLFLQVWVSADWSNGLSRGQFLLQQFTFSHASFWHTHYPRPAAIPVSLQINIIDGQLCVGKDNNRNEKEKKVQDEFRASLSGMLTNVKRIFWAIEVDG